MSRRGIALLAAVVVLAALGLVSTTAFSLARFEREAGQAALAEVQARAAMEAAMADALQGWPRRVIPVAPGAEVLLTEFNGPGPALGRAVLRALGGPVFAIVGTGTRWNRSGGVSASARAELLIRIDSTERFSPGDSLAGARIYPRGWRLLP